MLNAKLSWSHFVNQFKDLWRTCRNLPAPLQHETNTVSSQSSFFMSETPAGYKQDVQLQSGCGLSHCTFTVPTLLDLFLSLDFRGGSVQTHNPQMVWTHLNFFLWLKRGELRWRTWKPSAVLVDVQRKVTRWQRGEKTVWPLHQCLWMIVVRWGRRR